MNFYADEMFEQAEAFFDAQRILRDHDAKLGLSRPRYFLFCHAIELALKAYVASVRGINDDAGMQAMQFGHSIDKLLNAAGADGLALSPKAEGGIRARTMRTSGIGRATLRNWAAPFSLSISLKKTSSSCLSGRASECAAAISRNWFRIDCSTGGTSPRP